MKRRHITDNWLPGKCNGKGIMVAHWVAGDVVIGRGTVKRITKGRYDAKSGTEVHKITWATNAMTFLKAGTRYHLERCDHSESEDA